MTIDKELPAQGIERKHEKITLSDLYDATAAMGELFYSAFAAIGGTFRGVILELLAAFMHGWGYISRFFMRILTKAAALVISPFIRYKKALQMSSHEVARIKTEKGSFAGFIASAKMAGRMLLGKRGILVTAANWALPIVSCIFLFNVISFTNSQAYAIKLTVNGHFIGYIDDESVFNGAEKAVQKRINFTGSNTRVISFEPAYEIAANGYGTTLNTNQLTDKILGLISDDIADGYGMYIGDEYYGTISAHESVDKALASVLDKYRSESDKESVAFDKEISFVPGKYMVDSFVKETDMIKLLTSNKKVAAYYTVVDGDSPSAICDKVDMTYEELAALNPGFSATYAVYGGQKIKISKDEPFLSVIITREEHYTEEFDYETVYVDDSSYFEGDKHGQQNGQNGERAVVANVSYINGVEVNRHILSRTVTKEPVKRIVSVGTKPRMANSAPAQMVEAGEYLWPVGNAGGRISCLPWMAKGGYMHSYGGHKGLDIATPIGTPIYAAGTGTITVVKDEDHSGGFGNLIVIRHDDGKETYYAHLDTFSSTVYVGKRVTMGEGIAYSGNTGYSDGPHLHFEVRINGIAQYPPDYLPAHITEWGTYV